MQKNKQFSIGSSLDSDNSWRLVGSNRKHKINILPPSEHKLSIKSKKRMGKIVTIISEVFISQSDAEHLLADIKKRFGTGGSLKGNKLLIQGDLQNRCKSLLIEYGFKVI